MSRRTETAYKAKFPGELAQHNEAQWFRGYGKCCGCVAKVHVLIRGDLSFLQYGIFSGETTGGGHRLTKKNGVKSFPLTIEGLEELTNQMYC